MAAAVFGDVGMASGLRKRQPVGPLWRCPVGMRP